MVEAYFALASASLALVVSLASGSTSLFLASASFALASTSLALAESLAFERGLVSLSLPLSLEPLGLDPQFHWILSKPWEVGEQSRQLGTALKPLEKG